MAKKDNEKLADIIFQEIIDAKNEKDLRKADRVMLDIANASLHATQRSRFKTDLGRFCKSEPNWYGKRGTDECFERIAKRIGENQVDKIQTMVFMDIMISKIEEQIKKTQDIWETAKLIHSLYMLCDISYDYMEVIKEIVERIENDEQRRLAVICARLHDEHYEYILEVFRPGYEI